MKRPSGTIHNYLFRKNKDRPGPVPVTECPIGHARRKLLEEFKSGAICQKQLCKELKKLKTREEDEKVHPKDKAGESELP